MKRVRRLMANDLAYGLVLLVFVAAVVTWIYWPHGHARMVVRTQTTVVEVPPLTPLRDSGPKNNPQSATHSAGPPVPGSAPGKSNTTAGARKSSSTPAKRQAPKSTPTPRPSSHGSPQPSQPSSSPPSQPPPVVGVTVPALPGSVCLRPAATVNCP